MSLRFATDACNRVAKRYLHCFAKRALCPERRHFSTVNGTIEEGDVVLLRQINKPFASPLFTKPLIQGGKIETHYGTLKHDDIIGRSNREVVISSLRKPSRIQVPTLAEYVTLTPRIVTPIYPADANLIVSLLDIHVTPPDPSKPETGPPLEILEAGTGHGALTLHLARAIHAANLPCPRPDAAPAASASPETKHDDNALPAIEQRSEDERNPLPGLESNATHTATAPQPNEARDQAHAANLSTWKSSRRAILHTLDSIPRHTQHASKIVHGFRNGLYAGNVDFHTGDVSTFITTQQTLRQPPGGQIFHHIFLDLPGVHTHIATAAHALRDNGTLVVFAPSVTQVARCVEVVRRQRLPLVYEQVLELGPGYSGGKLWDVRAVKPLKTARALSEKAPVHVAEAFYSGKETGGETGRGTVMQRLWGSVRRVFGLGSPAPKHTRVEDEDEWVMVCRPNVGHRVVGGGFVGVWRRKREGEMRQEDEEVDDGLEKDVRGPVETRGKTSKRNDRASSRGGSIPP